MCEIPKECMKFIHGITHIAIFLIPNGIEYKKENSLKLKIKKFYFQNYFPLEDQKKTYALQNLFDKTKSEKTIHTKRI